MPIGVLLVSRLALFAACQAAVAGALALAGAPAPWAGSVGAWMLSALVANGLSLLLVVREVGGWAAYGERLRPRRDAWRGDLAWLGGVLLVAFPVGWVPNVVLAAWLWDDPATGTRLLLQPMSPVAAGFALLLFRPLHALSELPTYFVAAGPRLARRGAPALVAVLLPALFLGIQHIALPLVFDWRFAVWRAGMFLPFAVLVGVVLRARPGVLPYLLVVHLLMDAQLPVMAGLVGSGVMSP